MPRSWIVLILVVGVVSAAAGTANAQVCSPGKIKKVTCNQGDPPECVTRCVDAPPEAPKRPTRHAAPPLEDPYAAPPPKPSVPKPDPRCKPGEFVYSDEDGSKSCKSSADMYAMLRDIQARIKALQESGVPQGRTDEPMPPLSPVLKGEPEPTPEPPPVPEPPPPAVEQDPIAAELARLNARLAAIEKQLSVLQSVESRVAALEQEKLIPPVSVDTASKPRGPIWLELSAIGNVHSLTPYDQVLWATGAEIAVLPTLTDRWGLLFGAGAGYAGADDLGNKLFAVWATAGAQAQIVADLHLAFGPIMELRFDGDRKDTDSYGGFLQPKYCWRKYRPNALCGGIRAAVEATRFQGPQTGELFTRADSSFTATLGYGFEP
ncbi:hypothetical protein HY479_01220 [Candidatus Uhrbacteria bacterium]|nr:hypothetical protein [Candidatus Uhrbacteria bacterium]